MTTSFSRRAFLGSVSAVALGAALPRIARADAAQGWQERWTATVAAAEKEGEIAIAAPSGSLWREQLQAFRKDFPKITPKITPFAGRDFWPRLIKEREVGQNLWDIRVGGAETQVYELIKVGGLASVRDMFILPEVADESLWYGGFDHMFLDNARKHMLSFAVYESPLAFYNTKVIAPEELPSFRDLLNPRWKGKISIADPRGGSTAVSMAIVHHKFGGDFIRELLTTQAPVIVKTPRQQMGWFASGQYPIAMGIPNTAFEEFRDKGVDFSFGKVSGLDIWSVGVGGIQIPEPRPHPNATTVFVNWLLSRDVQARVMKAANLNSRRKDVPVVDPSRDIEWSRYKDYLCGQSEDLTQDMIDFKKITREVLK
ncbi:MAG: ABC transporter substrate-binding protein [Gemmatimonas sp.]